MIDFEADYYTTREKFADYLVYENDTNTYDTLVFVDTPDDVGFLDKSDLICVFDNQTGALIACVERITKKELTLIDRVKVTIQNLRVKHDAPVGFECYVKKRGEFIEYQYYKRWWYDLNIQLGRIDISKHVSAGRSREDKSST